MSQFTFSHNTKVIGSVASEEMDLLVRQEQSGRNKELPSSMPVVLGSTEGVF